MLTFDQRLWNLSLVHFAGRSVISSKGCKKCTYYKQYVNHHAGKINTNTSLIVVISGHSVKFKGFWRWNLSCCNFCINRKKCIFLLLLQIIESGNCGININLFTVLIALKQELWNKSLVSLKRCSFIFHIFQCLLKYKTLCDIVLWNLLRSHHWNELK